MRCMVCDAKMILIKVVPDETMPVPGFERRTFICSSCHDEEQHLAFVKPGCESDAEPVPVHVASSNSSDSEQPASLVDAAPPIAGEQSDDEQPMPLVDAPSFTGDEQRDDEQPTPLVDAGRSTAPASAVLDERPVARGLIGRVVAKVRGR
jgi:hypothetical protein